MKVTAALIKRMKKEKGIDVSLDTSSAGSPLLSFCKDGHPFLAYIVRGQTYIKLVGSSEYPEYIDNSDEMKEFVRNLK